MIGAVKRLLAPVRSGRSFQPIVTSLSEYSLCDLNALEVISQLTNFVKEAAIEGDVVECGVCNGGSAALIAAGMRTEGKRLWLYDSFAGLPETEEIDGRVAKSFVGKCVGTKENVEAALHVAGFPADLTIIKEGWFENTFKEPGPEKICFLHIDADWYSSVSSCLDRFYDRVSDGGIVLLDDFGYWEGCREAYYDFCERRKLRPVLERRGHSQAFWIKGKTHNRDTVHGT